MIRFFLFFIIFLIGFFSTIFFFHRYFSDEELSNTSILIESKLNSSQRPEIIGFLPYWLLSKANKEYSPFITTLTYFGLIISPDGTIQKFTNPTESEPGWYQLQSGNVDSFLQKAKQHNIKRSLLLFNGNTEEINQLLADPINHAKTVVEQVAPLMKQKEFTDLNIDIESVVEASDSARLNFIEFIKTIKTEMDNLQLGTITIDASPTDLIKKRLIDLHGVEPYVDYIVLMTYDYHYVGSHVTGPVAPIGGAGIEAEFDIKTGVMKALEVLPKEKIILGVPLYGYQWEALHENPRSAVIPTTGLVISNRRVEEVIASCTNCIHKRDEYAKEAYTIYKDEKTGTFHHLFYPDEYATSQKIQLAKEYQLRGLAVWALGYEGSTILNPLSTYKNY